MNTSVVGCIKLGPLHPTYREVELRKPSSV